MQNNTQECYICDLVTQIYGYYSIILITFSTIGNLFSSYVCYRLGLKKISTFKILSYVFILNATSLYTWVLDIFLKITIVKKDFQIGNIDDTNIVESYSIPTCKIFTFNQYFSLESLSWLLVYCLIDQNIQIYFPKIKYNCIDRICWLIIGFFFIFNSHILIFAGKIEYSNITINETSFELRQEVNCFHGITFGFYQFWPLWDKIHLFTYSFIPFVIMIACNFLTIKKLFQFKNNSTQRSATTTRDRKKRKLSIILLVTTFLFMVFSLQQVILFGYFFGNLASTKETFLILPASDLFSFTYIGMNFMIYLFTNRVFRNEAKFYLFQLKNYARLCHIKCLFCFRFYSAEEYYQKRDTNLRQNTKSFYDLQSKNRSLIDKVDSCTH